MQGLWPGVVLIAIVIVLGVAISLIQCKTKIQKRAVLGAFVALLLVVVVFYFMVIVNSVHWITPMFAAGCVVIPLSVYGGIASLGSRSNFSVPKRGSNTTPAKPIAKTNERRSAPVVIARPDPEIVPKKEPVVQKEEAISMAKASVFEEFEPEPASASQQAPAVETVPEPKVKYIVPSLIAEEPPASLSPVFDAQRYFTKATSFRDKGLFVIAARLYAECAEQAEDRQTFKKASIQQIACYVKAGQLEEAQGLAEALKATSSDLTPGENIKINAVLGAATR